MQISSQRVVVPRVHALGPTGTRFPNHTIGRRTQGEPAVTPAFGHPACLPGRHTGKLYLCDSSNSHWLYIELVMETDVNLIHYIMIPGNA